MGDDCNVQEIFEFEDSFGTKLSFLLEDSYNHKCRTLRMSEDEFVLTKPLARKIIKELKEEFKIE